jgi:hypothetical protein
MSRHHIQPPIVYVPQPRPKPVKTRPKIGRLLKGEKAASSSSVDASDESDESGDAPGPVPFNRQPATGGAYSFNLLDQKHGRSTTGRLSEGTLKTLLTTQEITK